MVYRSSAEAVTALSAGDLALALSDPGPANPALEGGRVRALAVTSAHRVAAYPDVPTMAEAGIPDFVVEYWIGLFAPAGLPEEILRQLAGQVRRIAALPEIRQRLAANSVEPDDRDPEGFRRAIAETDALWQGVARRAGISLER